MNQTIYKYELPLYGGTISMPRGAILLHVTVQADKPCLWAEVDPTAEQEERLFSPVGTGHYLPLHGRTYVGTTLLTGGSLVLHWYEIPMSEAD